MARFSQEIENKYGVATYQDTKNSYDWIIKAIQKIGGVDIKTAFGFSVSEIFCHCDNIEEFVEYAYGQANYDFTFMKFTIKSESGEWWFVFAEFDNKLRISTESKNLLERAVTSLKNTTLDEGENSTPISVTYVSHQCVETLVEGNSNIVANDHSSVVTGDNNSIGQSNKESLIKQWLKAIGQNLISNGVWYILCVLGGIVIARLAT